MLKAKVRRLKSDYIGATKKGAMALVVALVRQGESLSKRRVAKDTGRLANSISSEAKRYKGSWWTNVVYALAQEYGLPGKSYAFRPYMRWAARNLKKSLPRMSKAIMRKFYKNMRVQRENG